MTSAPVTSGGLLHHACLTARTSPFTRITHTLASPASWSSVSERSEMLPPGVASSLPQIKLNSQLSRCASFSSPNLLAPLASQVLFPQSSQSFSEFGSHHLTPLLKVFKRLPVNLSADISITSVSIIISPTGRRDLIPAYFSDFIFFPASLFCTKLQA